MNNRGKSMILLDLVIVVLLGALIYSFVRPTQLNQKDLHSRSEAEKTLSTLQVAIDMYKTKYDGELPGTTGEGIEAVKKVVADIDRSGVFQFDQVDLKTMVAVFDPETKGTAYKEQSAGNYELTVFSRDRYPFKYVLTQEKLSVVDPEKVLVDILGQLDGIKKDVQAEVEKFSLVKANIPKINENFAELAQREEEFKMIDDVYASFQKAESAAEINQKEYDTARELLQVLSRRVEEIKGVKSVSADVIRKIGTAYFDVEDYTTRLSQMQDYLKAGKLKNMAKGLINDAKGIMRNIDSHLDKFNPQQAEMAQAVDSRQEELEKWDGLLLEYKNKMQYVVQKFVDLKRAS
ncbi:MAG TPA: hypothetical protein ENN72_00010 [Firmicutes bacterium]|nr:hypothetical protein [Bacillota bacterium]